FITAFLVTLVLTPIVRKIAFALGVVDRPDSGRKMHSHAVPYLGGIAVLIGLLAAIAVSYIGWAGMWDGHDYRPVPLCIVVGMLAIGITGLADDVWGWDPRLKIAGQLVAAAALAVDGVGASAAQGVVGPLWEVIGLERGTPMEDGVVYWTGTALIAIFVLGGCNAANLIDGLDGLLSGLVAICAIGLVAIGIVMLPQDTADARTAQDVVARIQQAINTHEADPRSDPLPDDATAMLTSLVEDDLLDSVNELPRGFKLYYKPATATVSTDASAALAATSRAEDRDEWEMRRNEWEMQGARDGQPKPEKPEMPAGWSSRRIGETHETIPPLSGVRLVLALALLGAVLGFLPFNFNPANVFLGDSGSLLLGYMCVVVILMFGERGDTHLVFAGLIVFGVPIMDTMLAIIRRKLAGTSMSAADDQHIHHQLRRGLGTVKRAVFALYGIGVLFCIVGVSLAALIELTSLRVRFLYAIVIVLFSSIVVIAIKAARRHQRTAEEGAEAQP
ncbi:MAG: glycosyltransferase family 4 protein, partial [Planctomycetota bacterium]